MPRHASLDPYSLNQKIEFIAEEVKSLRSQIEAEMDELEKRFEDLYNMMNTMKVKKPKAKVKKTAHAKA